MHDDSSISGQAFYQEWLTGESPGSKMVNGLKCAKDNSGLDVLLYKSLKNWIIIG